MQYLWKITILGVSQQINRLVSLDGDLPLDTVLSLCNLAFDYDNYPEKALYFAQPEPSQTSLPKQPGQLPQADHCSDSPSHSQSTLAGRALLDSFRQFTDDCYGAKAQEFWLKSCDVEAAVAAGSLLKLDLQEKPSLKLEFATSIMERYMAAYADLMQASVDAQPNALELTPRFFYELHGVLHLVEIMKSSPKLMCFVPACLAGKGFLTDDEQKLSVAELERQFAAQAEQEATTGEGIGLDLRACTARMRALNLDLESSKANEVMLQAGAAPLKFVVSKVSKTHVRQGG